MTDSDTERVAFEKWFRSADPSNISLKLDDEGFYKNGDAANCWLAWQARALDSRCGELLEAAKIFGALLQPLHDEHKDHHPIYGINSVTITAGDLRRLTKAIAALEDMP